MQDKVVESGTMIIKQGDDGDVLYVIEEGCARHPSNVLAGVIGLAEVFALECLVCLETIP